MHPNAARHTHKRPLRTASERPPRAGHRHPHAQLRLVDLGMGVVVVVSSAFTSPKHHIASSSASIMALSAHDWPSLLFGATSQTLVLPFSVFIYVIVAPRSAVALSGLAGRLRGADPPARAPITCHTARLPAHMPPRTHIH